MESVQGHLLLEQSTKRVGKMYPSSALMETSVCSEKQTLAISTTPQGQNAEGQSYRRKMQNLIKSEGTRNGILKGEPKIKA